MGSGDPHFLNQLHSRPLSHGFPYSNNYGFNICRSGFPDIYDKIGVLGRNHCATDAKTFQST
jgi:hypothetical protein